MNEEQLFERFGRSYPVGSVLFREGDPGREMYVIQRGTVAISRTIRGRETIIARLHPGELFGEMAIINNRTRSATAAVEEEAALLVIGSQTFEAMLRAKTEIAVRIIKSLANRLDRANRQIDLLLVEDESHRVVKCLREMAEEPGPHSSDARRSVRLVRFEPQDLAARVALSERAVLAVLERLEGAKLVVRAESTSGAEVGFVIPEVGRLCEFLGFLEMKERRRTEIG